MNGLGDWIRYNAGWAGTRPALRLAENAYTYAELDAAVDRMAFLLRDGLGVRPGDRVAFLGLNSEQMILLLFACARNAASLLPLNNRLAGPEHEWILRHSGARFLFVEDEFAALADAIDAPGLERVAMGTASDFGWYDFQELLEETSDGAFDDVGTLDDRVLLIYTSGTTGQPKGVVHRQRALFYNALNAIHAQEMRASDHVLTVLPLFHSGGLNIQTSPAFYVGASVSLMRRFDPGETLRAIEVLKPTMFLAVPAVITALIDHPAWPDADLSSLRMVGTGSSTVPDPLLNAWHDRGVPATQIYGLTESAPTAICLPIAEARRKLGAAGKPVIHCQARIVDDGGRILGPDERGEIVLKGPNLFSEYLDDPETTAAAFSDGWFHTGDIGHTDDEGFFYVDDRKKDVVISGGENIYPAELENVLADMPELAEYAVVGRPDERWGEVPVACVVLREGAEIGQAELIARFAGRLARYKHPREVLFLGALPRNAMGKVLKFRLREEIAR
ncbi:MAG: AMP-binding protein [Pseudomonadales bacterium]|nr:long-chain fatty acid--CoA ligase [Pseudomonadales bacterium]NIX09158.1 AMP-binding protein [Pseudomonadales bacterium]